MRPTNPSPKRRAILNERAHAMRHAPTPSEAALFRLLSGRKLGVGFKRQVPLGDYIADFVAGSAKLVVEVDGPVHKLRRKADARKDRTLRRLVFTDQLDSGHEFARLKPVVCIIIMDFLEFQGPRFHSTFRVLEVHNYEEFSQHLEIHTLELPKLSHVTPDADDEAVLVWGKFFAADSDEQLEQLAMNHPNIAPATNALATLSQDPAARELARQRRLAELDYLSGIDEARAEGKAEGKAEGLQDAIRQLCHLLEIDLDVHQEQHLARSTVEELLDLQKALFKHRRWPQP